MSATSATPSAARPFWVALLAGGIVVGMAMGLRQAMSLYLIPITGNLAIGREPFSTAMAVANLLWGIGAVFSGAIADRYGAGRVVVTGALATILGLLMMYFARTGFDLVLSGVALGVGIAGTGVTALVGAVGRAAPPEKRTAAIASLGMASGIGGFVALAYTHVLIQLLSWQTSLLVLAGTAALMLPLAVALSGRPDAAAAQRSQSLGEAFREAFAHPSFWLLTSGFFVCGFHVAFYGFHLPAFVKDLGLQEWVGVWALIAVGIANIAGTYAAGVSARHLEKRISLSIIYLARCFVFLGLLYLPLKGAAGPWLIIGLSAVLGLFWLSTVPLTSSLVATFFGTQWMSMLFGFVFLSHQLGSFAGLWLAGRLYDASRDAQGVGSYDAMWWICIAVGLFAAAIHWPIRERPVARLAAAAAR